MYLYAGELIMHENGWTEWSKYVLKELERLNDSQTTIEKRLNNIDISIGMLKVKSGIWGAIAGAIPAVVALVIITMF